MKVNSSYGKISLSPLCQKTSTSDVGFPLFLIKEWLQYPTSITQEFPVQVISNVTSMVPIMTFLIYIKYIKYIIKYIKNAMVPIHVWKKYSQFSSLFLVSLLYFLKDNLQCNICSLANKVRIFQPYRFTTLLHFIARAPFTPGRLKTNWSWDDDDDLQNIAKPQEQVVRQRITSTSIIERKASGVFQSRRVEGINNEAYMDETETAMQ